MSPNTNIDQGLSVTEMDQDQGKGALRSHQSADRAHTLSRLRNGHAGSCKSLLSPRGFPSTGFCKSLPTPS